MRANRSFGFGIFLATVVGAVLMSATAWADHDQPTSAREFKSSLVKAYEVCNLGDTNAVTPGGLPACSPAVPLDTQCEMEGAGAKGKVSISAEQHDLRINLDIQGVTGCEGESLILRATPRVTSDNCLDPITLEPLEENCTLAGPVTIPLAGCIVSNGQCKMDTTIETAFPFIDIQAGNDEGFEIDDCEVVRATDGPSVPVLSCGVLVP